MDLGIPVSVHVVDAETHRAVLDAEVVLGGSSERHAVSTETASTTWSVEYLPDGTELFFARGMTLELDVLAPGYAPSHATLVVPRGRRPALTVEIAPVVWASPGADAPPVEHQARVAWQAWTDRSDEMIARPDAETVTARARARTRVAAVSEDWLAWLDETGNNRTVAEQVCRSASSHPARCEP